MGIGSFGGTELLIALVIILLLFGAKRIPELAKGLGSGMREFKRGTRGEGEGEIEEKKEEEKKEEDLVGKEDEPKVSADPSVTAEGSKTENRQH
ncbi:MAG TPA: twin-arginine translocase TatA/TatE family subunit [Rubrobacteraceae bacterium]|jgi:sec-independent protein translocase protein TatA|nr:twin-arginine translocase TatA/TatE family subunit [Rubrobacteraceae bacterium]